MIKHKEGHYIMIKRSVLQENTTILNMYVPDNRASSYVRQKPIELQGEVDESIIIVGDFNILLSEMDRSSRQKISKDIVELNNTINQLDVKDIYRLLHPTTEEYTFFSSSYRKVTKMDHILGHKTHLNKVKRIEIIQYDHNGIKLEIHKRKITGKYQNAWRLNNTAQRGNLQNN